MMKKLKLFLAALALTVGGVNVNAQTDVTASYVGDLSKIVNGHSSNNGACSNHKLSNAVYPQASAWWNDQTLPSGWHAFQLNGSAYESWTPGIGSAGVMMGRTMNLPEGSYTLSFKAFGCTASNATTQTASSAGDVVAFCTGQENIDITNTTLGGNTFHDVSFTFTVTEANSTYSFGIRKVSDSSYSDWCQIKDVTLTLTSTNITPIENNVTTGWTQTFDSEESKNGGYAANTWSVEGNSDGTNFLAPFNQIHIGSGNTLSDQTVSNSFTPTANGVYKMSAWVRAYNEAGGSISGAKIFIGDTEADACTGSDITRGKLGTYTAMADGVSGTPITYGFKIKDATINWISWKNVTFTYYAEMPEAEKTALLALVPTGKMNASVQSTLDGYKSAFQNNASVANYNNLSLYIPTAQASVAVYEVINSAITTYAAKAAALDATGAAAYSASAIQTKYDNGTYTTLLEAETELMNALAAAAKAQTTEGADMTTAIINPSFETGELTGWTTTQSGDTGVKLNSIGTYHIDNADGNYLFNTWNGDATGYDITQTLTSMPAGMYTLTARFAGYVDGKVNIKAGTASTTFTNTATGTGTDASVNFKLDSAGDIIIGAGNADHWYKVDHFRLIYLGEVAGTSDYTELTTAISTANSKTLGFDNGEFAPYNNVDALTALAAAQAIDQEVDNAKSIVTAATSALNSATWTANTTDRVEAVYNGDFAIGQGSSYVDIQKYGWTRTNGWGQFKSDADATSTSNRTAYYNQAGSMQYGNAGAYTMPLKASTVYTLKFKYAAQDANVPTPTVSVLNGDDGMAAMMFASNANIYTASGAFAAIEMVFVTGVAGSYILTIAGNHNLVITDVSIKEAESQILEFADGSVPTYAPGTYPSVKISRTLTAGRWATAVYPFAVSGVENLTIANLDSYSASNGALGFSTTANASEANVPFLMLSTAADDIENITLSDVEVVETAATPTVTKSEASLKGVYASTNITNSDKNYVLSSNVIYPVGTAGAIIPAYRAYIQVAQPAARSLTFFVDGEATAIEGISNDVMENGDIYNLQGQRVQNAQKGLFIQNGKKVVRK